MSIWLPDRYNSDSRYTLWTKEVSGDPPSKLPALKKNTQHELALATLNRRIDAPSRHEKNEAVLFQIAELSPEATPLIKYSVGKITDWQGCNSARDYELADGTPHYRQVNLEELAALRDIFYQELANFRQERNAACAIAEFVTYRRRDLLRRIPNDLDSCIRTLQLRLALFPEQREQR